MDSLSLFYPDPIHGLFSFFFLHKVVIYNKIVHPRPKKCIIVMVLILDGNSEIGVHVRSNLCNLISFRSREVTNSILSRKTPISLHACVTWSELPSTISAMVIVLLVTYSIKAAAPGTYITG